MQNKLLTRSLRRRIIALLGYANSDYSSSDSVRSEISKCREAIANLAVEDELVSLSEADAAMQKGGWERISPWSVDVPMYYGHEDHLAVICGDSKGYIKWTRNCPWNIMDETLLDLAQKNKEK